MLSWYLSRKLAEIRFVLSMGNYTSRRMNHKLANSREMWEGNGNTTTSLFSLKGLEILHQERRGQVNTMVMEHFKSILLPNSDLLISSIPINRESKQRRIPYYDQRSTPCTS